MLCPSCDSTDVETLVINEEFAYGVGVGAVTLHAVIPVRRCKACRMEFTDYEAEDSRTAAVTLHRFAKIEERLDRLERNATGGIGRMDLGRKETT